MPTLTLNQTQIKNINKGVLNIEIPLSFLIKILSLEKKTATTLTLKNNIWQQAYGLWKNKLIDPLKYQRKLRNEWL